MSSIADKVRSGGIRGCTTAVAMLLVWAPGMALGDTPDAEWNTPWVQVQGNASQDVASTVSAGLKSAGETYFYGSRATKMVANVTGSGSVDLTILDQATGSVLAEQRGVSFSDATSLEAAALNWMDRLQCRDNCAFAEAGAAPAPVQVAVTEEPAEPAEEVAVVAAAQVEPAEETEPQQELQATAEVDEVATPAVADADAADADEAVAATEPEAAVAEEQVAVKEPEAAAPAEEIESPTAVAEAPTTGDEDTSPEAVALIPTAEPSAVTAPAAVAANTATAAAPATGGTDEAPTVTAPATPEPAVEVKVAEELGEGQDADEVLARTEPEDPVQEIAPGIRLPLPKPSDRPTAVALAVGAAETPAVNQSLEQPVTRAADPADTAPAATEETAATETAPEVAEEQAAPATPVEQETAAAAAEEPEETTASKETETAAAAPTQESAETSEASDTAEATAPVTPEDNADDAAAQLAAELEAALRKPENAEAAGSETAETTESEQGEQLALVAPPTEEIPSSTTETPAAATEIESQATGDEDASDGGADSVNTQVAAVDPNAGGPTLANARWVGFTPAVHSGKSGKSGSWIAGPFDRKERVGWITDTATGATTRVTFVWREGGSGGRTAELSREAADALGLSQGDVANVAVYLPR